MTLLADRVKETATTTGTGAVTLGGASAGYRTFVAGNGVGLVYYAIVHQTAAEWEVGIGTLTTGPDVLARTTVLTSSNANALVSFSAGTKDVFCTVPAAAFVTTGGLMEVLRPTDATFPATNFPQLVKNAGTNLVDYTLDFDTVTGETAYWKFAIPVGMTPASATIEIFSRQGALTTGTVGWIVGALARGDADAWDTALTNVTVTAATVKGTVGQLLRQQATFAMTGWAASKSLYFAITRDVANDTCAEDAKFVEAVVRIL
jgi:hypothetical protein